ncbi:MAG: hypothetical protein JW395_3486 [Nitrospira sp.]|nr:hypothetical protein [Nitrospira sp.]
MALRRTRSLAQSIIPPLAFHKTGGPVVAISGLAGGVGASTLTFLLASIAANHSDVPVLAMDTGGPMACLDYFAGVKSEISLVRAANQVSANQVPQGLIVGSPYGARIMTVGRERDNVEFDPAGVVRMIEFARQAHGLTIIDCGTLQREIEHCALAAATHVIWVFSVR